jgi:MFS family permease
VALLADLSPLRQSAPFRRLWAGSTLSLTGSALTRFAAVLQVYDVTRSPAAVGLIGLAVMVPLLVVGLLGGALIDAADRRTLVLATTTGNMVVAAAIAAQAYLHLAQVWPLYLLLALQSGIGAINEPARRSLIPALLSGDGLAAGLALQRLTGQITLIAGPALAGVIVAAPHLGLSGCYLIDTVTFTAALYGTWRLPPVHADKSNSPERARFSAVIAGFSFIRRTPVVAGAFLADVNATFFGLPTALFPAINAERFGGDPRTLGLFTASIGVGGLIAAVLSGPVRHVSRQGLAMLVTVTVWGAGFAVFAVAPWLWLVLLSLGVAGAADTGTVVLRGLIVQTVTPDEFRGRVTAADYAVGAGGGQLGSLESGVLGSLTTPEISALSGGLLTIVGAVVIGIAMPAFAWYRAPAAGAGTGRDAVPLGGPEHLADVEPGG